MAANTVGHQQTDHLRTMALVEAGLEFAREVLRPGGAYVAKVLAGGADNELVAELKRHFATVKHAKPPASRKDSSEWYVVAQGFKGQRTANGCLGRNGHFLGSAISCGRHAVDGLQYGTTSVPRQATALSVGSGAHPSRVSARHEIMLP